MSLLDFGVIFEEEHSYLLESIKIETSSDISTAS